MGGAPGYGVTDVEIIPPAIVRSLMIFPSAAGPNTNMHNYVCQTRYLTANTSQNDAYDEPRDAAAMENAMPVT